MMSECEVFMSFDALEPINRRLTPAWCSSQVSTSPWRRWASPGCLLSPPTLLEARHHAGPRTQFTVTEWQVSDRAELHFARWILHTEYWFHSSFTCLCCNGCKLQKYGFNGIYLLSGPDPGQLLIGLTSHYKERCRCLATSWDWRRYRVQFDRRWLQNRF